MNLFITGIKQKNFLFAFFIIFHGFFIPSVMALTFSMSLDNDGPFLTDREYTSGLFIRAAQKVSPYGYSLELGSQMWTPRNISYHNAQPDQRPFAGLLYLQARINFQTEKLAIKGHSMLGLLGPDSQAENLQVLAHKITGASRPNGWQHQIYNQTVFQFGLEAQHILFRPQDDANELSLITRGQIGNFQNEIALGAAFRIGTRLQDTFGSISPSLNNTIDTDMLAGSATGFFMFTLLEARYRDYDATIEGDKPSIFDNLKTKNEQSSFAMGVVYYKKTWGIASALVWQSRLYVAQRAKAQNIANVTLFYRF